MTATQCARFFLYKWKREKVSNNLPYHGESTVCPTEDCMIHFNIGFDLLHGRSLRREKRECKLSNKTFYVTRERSAKKCVKCQIFDQFY